MRIVWLIPQLDLDNPSIRLRRFNIHQKLNEMGIESVIIKDYYDKDIYNQLQSFDIIIFTQISRYDYELMLRLKDKRLIQDHCEALFGLPYETEAFNTADVIACCSTKLEELTRQNGFQNTSVIRDAIEDTAKKFKISHNYDRDKLKAGYIGMGGNSFIVSDYLKDTIERAGYEIILCTEWDNATHKWTRDTWMDVMNDCDVILCPQRTEIQPAKSNVKATTAMALGMPVIASPIDSYKECIRHGENGYLCHTKEQWYDALIELKDPQKRKQIGLKAKEVIESYSLDVIANQWKELFDLLLSEKMVTFENASIVKNPTDPKAVYNPVDIIVVNNSPLEKLKGCINSILMQTSYTYRLIVSDATGDKKVWDYLSILKGVTVVGARDKVISVVEASNDAIQRSSTRFFVLMGSDITIEGDWLAPLVKRMEETPRLAACNPVINSETKDSFEKVSELSYSLTIYARSALNEIGLFDPLYKESGFNLDMCWRLRKYNYALGIDYSVRAQKSEILADNPEDIEKYITKKGKKKIAIFMWSPMDGAGVIPRDWARQEPLVSKLAQGFSRKDYAVTVYNGASKPGKGGCGEHYRPCTLISNDIANDYFDFFIAIGNTDVFSKNVHTNRKFVIVKDMWMSPEKSYDTKEWQIEKYILQNERHKRIFIDHHNIPAEKVIVNPSPYDDIKFWEELFS